ncbi:hypothetical protein Q1695_015410 [Nippostrongylus brasiliensis]|nr:hypothetical protein Q1695_015410 [Nippostrongylus brasiliensis]
MELLPPELLLRVCDFLQLNDRISLSLVCSRIFAALGRVLPRPSNIHVQIGNCPAIARVQNNDSSVALCQCNRHDTQSLLSFVIPLLLKNATSLQLEDELARDRIQDSYLHKLLTHCAYAPLTRLALSNCDLAGVKPWTIAQLAQFHELQELIFDGCTFSVSESQLIRGMSPSFNTLSRLEISDNPQITDKLARAVARCCPKLENFCVSGCASVSALSVLVLMEAAFCRVSQMLTMHVEKTAFDVDELSRFIHSPLFNYCDEWRLTPASINLGYEKSAVKLVAVYMYLVVLWNALPIWLVGRDKMKTMWDLLVLTAGSERQRQNFELILGEVNTSPYCRKTMVIADYPPNVKIGSGGATLNVLRIIEESTCGKKVLLIHSGGLSQRTPQLSAFGKVFATLPNGSTVLEMKLRSYKSLSTALPAGLLVSASDVLEDTSMFRDCSADSDMILFATESTLKVASNHGVFVMRDGQLVSVLQKPSLDLIRSSGAVLPSGNVLTDCFYWMSWRVCKQLTSLWTSRGPCLVETCCYGDFMRPLGSQPALDYLETGNAELSSWRKALFHVFSRITPEIINLGSDAFFHLGTSQEILEHCTIESTFSKKFLERFDYNVYCDNKEVETGSGSLMEYCRVNGAQIGKGSYYLHYVSEINVIQLYYCM